MLTELGYVDEIEAAAGLDLTPPTLAGYRKNGIGPRYTELARKIMYSKKALAEWLEAGGTKSAAAIILVAIVLLTSPPQAQASGPTHAIEANLRAAFFLK